MTSPFAAVTAGAGQFLAQEQGKELGTQNLQTWITGNIVPLLLLVIAVILLWIGGRGDNAGVARRGVGLLVGLVALGIAVSGKAGDVGQFLANLIVG
ncbi:hypothetical protein [Pseudonocardia spinosispora]|uniref:hypothetical protein n=1 Tax=Pseudonocardia spinosispora TaxID=103441 RepID=UPI0003FDD3E1|nr:hypothetical protein [Pseudonocardia spinosispora]